MPSNFATPRVPCSFQFPTGSVLSADPGAGVRLVLEEFGFQFPTGSVLSADALALESVGFLLRGFQFPTGSVLSADQDQPWLVAAGAGVSIPHGKCPVCRLDGHACLQQVSSQVSIPHGKCPVCRLLRGTTRRCAKSSSFNSPREVSCLPTCTLPSQSFHRLRGFNSPREVSCLPTAWVWRPQTSRHLFQFPTGSVLSADVALSEHTMWVI